MGPSVTDTAVTINLVGRDVNRSHDTDGRVERWREHRAQRRIQLVDATLVALELHGPDVSLQQIADVAGIPKPKIYRHFEDKADLVSAVGERLRDQVVGGLVAALEPGITVREHARRSLDAYFRLVEKHPNASRMLRDSAPLGRGRSNAIAEAGRSIAQLISAFAAEDLSRAHLPTDGVDPLTHAMVGAVLGTTDWWMLQPVETRMARERVVENLTIVLLGAGDAALREIGVALDPEAVIGAEHLIHLTAASAEAP